MRTQAHANLSCQHLSFARNVSWRNIKGPTIFASFCRRVGDRVGLEKSPIASLRRLSNHDDKDDEVKNNWFYEQNNSSARASRFLVHFMLNGNEVCNERSRRFKTQPQHIYRPCRKIV